jgi:hypothetical protein
LRVLTEQNAKTTILTNVAFAVGGFVGGIFIGFCGAKYHYRNLINPQNNFPNPLEGVPIIPENGP